MKMRKFISLQKFTFHFSKFPIIIGKLIVLKIIKLFSIFTGRRNYINFQHIKQENYLFHPKSMLSSYKIHLLYFLHLTEQTCALRFDPQLY